MKKVMLLVVGAVCGIALVVACERRRGGEGGDAGFLDASFFDSAVSAGADAAASPADCEVWQIAYLEDEPLQPGLDGAIDLPAGWEPFIVYGGSRPDSSSVYVRRCSP